MALSKRSQPERVMSVDIYKVMKSTIAGERIAKAVLGEEALVPAGFEASAAKYV